MHALRLHSDTVAAYTKASAATNESQAPMTFATRTMSSGTVLPRARPLCPVTAANGMEMQKKYDEPMSEPAMNQRTPEETEKDGKSAATENMRIAAIGRL